MKKLAGVAIWAASSIAITVAVLLAVRHIGPLQRLAGITPAEKPVVG